MLFLPSRGNVRISEEEIKARTEKNFYSSK